MESCSNTRLKLNVGGRVFETSLRTLKSAGENSFLARSAESAVASSEPELFFDSDPEVFATLLNILRTRKWVASERVSKPQLIEAAEMYGVTEALKVAMAPSNPLTGFDIEKVGSVAVNGRDFPSAISAAPDGSLLVAHGNKVTFFDWALQKRATTLTRLTSIEFLLRISHSCFAAGSPYVPGLHFYERNTEVKSLKWSDPKDLRNSKSAVHAIAGSEALIFASFHSCHAFEVNTILAIDKSRLETVREIAWQKLSSHRISWKTTRLQWIPGFQLLATTGIYTKGFEDRSYLRLYDVRSGKVVLDWGNLEFDDVIGSEGLTAMVKVTVQGALAMVDLRKLGDGTGGLQWTPLVEYHPGLGGNGSKLMCYNKEIIHSRGEMLRCGAS